MDLRGQSDMRKLEEVTGRKYKPLKYWANFDPSDAKLVFDVSPGCVCMQCCSNACTNHFDAVCKMRFTSSGSLVP